MTDENVSPETTIQTMLESFEVDGDGWIYYGDINPKDASAELAKIVAELDRLKAKDLDSRRCMYCGGSVPDTDQAMLDHIFSCEKRPEKTLLAKAFEVEDGLYAKIKHLVDNVYLPGFCEVCDDIAKDMARYDSVQMEEANG